MLLTCYRTSSSTNTNAEMVFMLLFIFIFIYILVLINDCLCFIKCGYVIVRHCTLLYASFRVLP